MEAQSIQCLRATLSQMIVDYFSLRTGPSTVLFLMRVASVLTPGGAAGSAILTTASYRGRSAADRQADWG